MTTRYRASGALDPETYVPLEEVMAHEGLGPYQVRREIRAGRLPGKEDMYGRFKIWRTDWDAYKAGEWNPVADIVEAEAPKPPVGLVQRNRLKAS